MENYFKNMLDSSPQKKQFLKHKRTSNSKSFTKNLNDTYNVDVKLISNPKIEIKNYSK